MEFSCRNDFGQFLHVDGFDIEDVYASEKMCKRGELEGEEKKKERELTERLIRNVQVPQVDSQIICTHVRLTIRVDRD